MSVMSVTDALMVAVQKLKAAEDKAAALQSINAAAMETLTDIMDRLMQELDGVEGEQGQRVRDLFYSSIPFWSFLAMVATSLFDEDGTMRSPEKIIQVIEEDVIEAARQQQDVFTH